MLVAKGGLSAIAMLPSGEAAGRVAEESVADRTHAAKGSGKRRQASAAVSDGLSASGGQGATPGTTGSETQEPASDGNESQGEPQQPDSSAVASGTPGDDAGTTQAEYGEEDDERRQQDEQPDDSEESDSPGSLDGFCPFCHNHCPLTNPRCLRPRNAGLIG